MTDAIGDTRNASLAFYKQCLNWNLKIQSQPVLHVTLYFTFISYNIQSSCEEILNKGQSFKWSEPTLRRPMYEQLQESMYNLSFFPNLNMELGLNMQQKKKEKR